MKLHYRKDLTVLSHGLRKAGILSEVLLWNELKRNALGVRFLRQRPVGRYIVDFYCHALELVVEIDGSTTHDNRQKEDASRQSEIEALGIAFLRFKDADVQFNLAGVVDKIRAEILKRKIPPSSGVLPLRKGE